MRTAPERGDPNRERTELPLHSAKRCFGYSGGRPELPGGIQDREASRQRIEVLDRECGHGGPFT